MKLNQSLSISDSLIYSLCREVEYIRQRAKNINLTLSTCKDKLLKLRLENEIENLKIRQYEVKEISNNFISICYQAR